MSIIIKASEKETLEQMLKRYKKESKKRKQIKEFRERRFFEKKSVKRRKKVQKAIYTEHFISKLA